MSRGPVVYTLPPGTTPQQPNDVIQSAVWNSAMDDIANTFNTIQPVEYGGTGSATVAGAPFLGKVGTSTDNAIVRFDGTTGNQQNSGILIDDSNNLSIPSGSLKVAAGGTDAVYSFVTGQSSYTFYGTEGTAVIGWLYNRTTGQLQLNSGASVGAATGLWYINKTTGNLGLGYSSPVAKLAVNGGFTVGQNTTISPGLANTTTGIGIDATRICASSATAAMLANVNADTSCVVYNRSGVTVGSVSVTTTTATYNTTSDYRRKPIREALTDFWGRLSKVIPHRFQWDNGQWDRGFIAHEFAEVYPNSVSGEKDAVDEDGKPVYQSMQASTSEVMADVLAALQDIQKRLTALEAK